MVCVMDPHIVVELHAGDECPRQAATLCPATTDAQPRRTYDWRRLLLHATSATNSDSHCSCETLSGVHCEAKPASSNSHQNTLEQ